jgi:hypothetical protein
MTTKTIILVEVKKTIIMTKVNIVYNTGGRRWWRHGGGDSSSSRRCFIRATKMILMLIVHRERRRCSSIYYYGINYIIRGFWPSIFSESFKKSNVLENAKNVACFNQ